MTQVTRLGVVSGCWGRVRMNGSDSTARMDIVLEGWLTKSPPKKFWKGKWRRRWFILRQGEYPGQYYLEYYTDAHANKLKGRIELDQCEQVDADLAGGPRKWAYNHMFDIRTPKRVFYLAADSQLEMNKWVDCICHVCGLKPCSQDDEYSYDMTHSMTVQQQPHPQSPESPPVSGPYIPLDQCLSGPLPLQKHYSNDDTDKSPTTPGTDRESVFTDDDAFYPPAVNWSTFPRTSDSSGLGEEIPPRPPKAPHLVAVRTYVPNETNNKPIENIYDNTKNRSSPLKRDGIVFRYDFPDGASPNTESISGSSEGSNALSPSHPPPADRSLKPAPVINRRMKPQRAAAGFRLDPPPLGTRGKQRAAPSPALHGDGARKPDELQYIDLDLPEAEGASSSPHTPPRSAGPTTHTVYKTIDIVKTQALNVTRRHQEEAYRKSQD